ADVEEGGGGRLGGVYLGLVASGALVRLGAYVSGYVAAVQAHAGGDHLACRDGAAHGVAGALCLGLGPDLVGQVAAVDLGLLGAGGGRVAGGEDLVAWRCRLSGNPARAEAAAAEAAGEGEAEG